MKEHLFVSSTDGGLYDTRSADWSAKALRAVYRRTFASIDTVEQLKATLRSGSFAWPGGYPLYFVTSDGDALSFAAVRAELRNVIDALASGRDDGWRVVGCEINWEDGDLTCAHTGERIESAYGED